MKFQCDRPQLVYRQPQSQSRVQIGLVLRLIQLEVNPLPPSLIESQVAPDGVHGLEYRRQSRFQRAFPENGPGEAVQRLDGGPVQVGQGALAAEPLVVVQRLVGYCFLQRPSDAVAQFRRGGVGKGYDGNLVQRGPAGCGEFHHPVNQAGGLAGARTRFYKQGLVEGLPDTLPHVVVLRYKGRSQRLFSFRQSKVVRKKGISLLPPP